MDLRDLVCGFGAIGALALLYEACRRLASVWRTRTAPIERSPIRSRAITFARRSATGFGAVGAALLVILFIVFQGRWREREAPVFPIRPLDLHAAPAAVEVANAQDRLPEPR